MVMFLFAVFWGFSLIPGRREQKLLEKKLFDKEIEFWENLQFEDVM